jgi:hypothetical protein
MSESDQEPGSDYTSVSVPDDDLPEDLQPGGDNPLAEASDDDAERQDLGDPHIEGLERDDDDNRTLPDADADGDKDSDESGES